MPEYIDGTKNLHLTITQIGGCKCGSIVATDRRDGRMGEIREKEIGIDLVLRYVICECCIDEERANALKERE